MSYTVTPAMLNLLRSVWEDQDSRVLGAFAALASQYRAHLLIDPVAALGSPLPGRDDLLKIIRSGTLDGASDFLTLAAREAGITPSQAETIFQTLDDYYQDYFPQLAGDMDGSMSTLVNNAITKGIQSGMGEKDLGEKVLGSVLNLGQARLRTIVRTELTNAATLSRVGVFSLAGVTLFEYQAILDDVTTKTCRCLDGYVLDPTNPLAVQLFPANHYRCRALVIPADERATPSSDKALQKAIEVRAKEFPSWGGSRLAPALSRLAGGAA